MRRPMPFLIALLLPLALVPAVNAAEAEEDPIHVVEGEVEKPVRVGGPLPGYPELPKEERIEGTVVARVVIEKDGTIGDAEIVESLRDDFDARTLEVLRQWTFEPATLDGEPVRVYYHLTVNYVLEREPPAAD